MSDQGESTIKNLGIFSTLQAATDTKFFLLSASFALLIDNAFLFLEKPGLIALATSKEALATSNVAFQAILIFIAFSFLTSLVLPIAAAIADEIYIHTAGSWLMSLDFYLGRKFGIESMPTRREYNYVRSSELRDEAHQSKEKYYLDLYKDHMVAWSTWRENRLRFALYSFYCFVMLGTNLYVALTGKASVSFAITTYCGGSHPIWLALTMLLFMVFWRFYDKSEPEWIYCPSLYTKVMNERKQ